MKSTFLTLLTLLWTLSIWAKQNPSSAGTDTVVIQKVGVLNNQPVYSIMSTSTHSEGIYLVIKDEYGQFLQEETLSVAKAEKQFLFNIDDLGNTGVIIEIYN